MVYVVTTNMIPATRGTFANAVVGVFESEKGAQAWIEIAKKELAPQEFEIGQFAIVTDKAMEIE